jgi:hypothetical protein
MEEDAEVKKAVEEYYDAQDKREWVEWAGKTLMPCLHMQIVMEKADAERVKQDVMDEVQLQAERVQRCNVP